LTCVARNTTCYPSTITPVTTPNEPIRVVGKPATFTEPKVFSLKFQNTVMKYVPTRIFSIYTKVQEFRLGSVSLTNLVTDAIKTCSNLTTLFIYDNNFPTIPAKFAQSCTKLQDLRFVNDNIKGIDENAFFGLTELLYLTVSFNKNLLCIPSKLFQNTPKLEMLSIYNNSLTAIDPELFKNLPKLYSIDFRYNKIEYLPKFDARFLNDPQRLSNVGVVFTNNSITAVDPLFLKTLYTVNVEISREVYTSLFFNPCVLFDFEIYRHDWDSQDFAMEKCYTNWTPELASRRVLCGSK
jgi:Leucine-rich repeat (LRR) protein